MRFDSRIYLFLVCAAACLFLAPVATGNQRHVAFVLGIVYVVLALVVFLDSWSRKHTKPNS